MPAAVHPPPFRRQQRLSDWPDCRLELHCCRGQSVYPVRLMLRDHGDRTFAEVLAKLRCRQCGRPPAPVYLCAGTSRAHHGRSTGLGDQAGARTSLSGDPVLRRSVPAGWSLCPRRHRVTSRSQCRERRDRDIDAQHLILDALLSHYFSDYINRPAPRRWHRPPLPCCTHGDHLSTEVPICKGAGRTYPCFGGGCSPSLEYGARMWGHAQSPTCPTVFEYRPNLLANQRHQTKNCQ
jgi:hypothetical protein